MKANFKFVLTVNNSYDEFPNSIAVCISIFNAPGNQNRYKKTASEEIGSGPLYCLC